MIDISLLHVHAQGAWHDEAFLVGNRAGLTAARDAIDRALAGGEPAACEVSTSDGEGFSFVAVLDDRPWDGMWGSELPYTDEIAAGGRAGGPPWPGDLPGVPGALKHLRAARG